MEQYVGKNLLTFIEELPNDDACKAYLAKYKWQDGFKCPKCGGVHGCMKKDYRYHCYTCSHVESFTADTLFHKVKFGLHKAFCIVFDMTTTSKSMSSTQMAERYGITQGTARYFHQVKSWLRTIPTHVSRMHIEKYFNEYSYQINRSQAKENIWHNTILRMLKHMSLKQK